MVSEPNANSPKPRRPGAAGDAAPPPGAAGAPADAAATAMPSMPAGSDAESPDDPAAPLELVLVKDGRRFVFRYHRGEESQVLESIATMARDPQSKLTLFDAAVLSHQMGQAMRKRLEKLLRA